MRTTRFRWRLRGVALSVALASTAISGAGLSQAAPGGFAFTAPQFFNASRGVLWDIRVADFNNDGRPDLATANALQSGDGGVSVLLNDTSRGSATARFSGPTRLASRTLTTGVAVGDLNNDGRTDIAAANTGVQGPGGLTVTMNRTARGASTPRFGPAFAFDAGLGPTQVGMVDLNDDGKLDLLVGNSDTAARGTSVLMNTTPDGSPTPTFTKPFFFDGGAGPEGTAFADVNGDGHVDVVVGDTYSSNVATYLNTTPKGSLSPRLSETRMYVPTANSVSLTDFNADGKPDLAANISLGTPSAGLVTSVNRTPTGSLTPRFQGLNSGATVHGTGFVPEYQVTADFDGDGRPDVATANDVSVRNLPGGVSVLRNTTVRGAASITFAPQQFFAGGWLCNAIATADFNADGRPDLATGHIGTVTGADGVAVLMNTTR